MPESTIEYVLDSVDLVLVMTVNPGFGGQSFLGSQIGKMRRIRSMIGDRPIRLQVDDGITRDTASAAVGVLVAGSAVFRGQGRADHAAIIAAIRTEARAAATSDVRAGPVAKAR